MPKEINNDVSKDKKKREKKKTLSHNLFPVVGIGASAGGIDAFKRLI